MTGRDLIAAALRKIGAIASGESPRGDEATDGLAALNSMLDSWSNESLMVFSRVRGEFALTPGQQSYTIGTGGGFNTPRPQQIEYASLLDDSVVPSVETPIDVIRDLNEWVRIGVKGLESSSPSRLYMDDQFPQAQISFWPVPNAARKAVLYMWQPLSLFTMDTVVELPPGYERALIYNLAIEIAPEFGRTVADTVAAVASESKAAILRKNIKPVLLSVDSALLQGCGSGFDIYSGGTR